MAFSTARGRPRKPSNDNDPGTPELRLKHALQLTAEPIDVCLEKGIITAEQHWCGLHLRWLYTLRYGAPNLTTQYVDRSSPGSPPSTQDINWRAMREREYSEAVGILRVTKRYECVMRLAVFNESPAFLNPRLFHKATQDRALAERLARAHAQVDAGLSELVRHWQRRPATDRKATPQRKALATYALE